MKLVLAALLSLPSLSRAAAPESVRCPGGKAPLLTGRLFTPLSCPPDGQEPARASVSVSTEMAPLDAKGGDLRALEGKWRGLCYWASRRFECELEVSGGGAKAVWLAMDYHSHLGNPVELSLKKPGWFSHGAPKAELVMPRLPGAKLVGRAWLAPGVAAWKFDGRPEVHRLEYAVSGAKLDVSYVQFDAEHGRVATGFQLDRVQ